MTVELCRYLVCREPAVPESEPVALCFGHYVITDRAIARRREPHLTPDGALYVGDLDELLPRAADL